MSPMMTLTYRTIPTTMRAAHALPTIRPSLLAPLSRTRTLRTYAAADKPNQQPGQQPKQAPTEMEFATEAKQKPSPEPQDVMVARGRRQPQSSALTTPSDPTSFHRLSRYMSDMQREMESLMRQFIGPSPFLSPSSSLLPTPTDLFRGLDTDFLAPAFTAPSATASLALDVTENEDSYVVAADVPGLSKDEIKVTVTPDRDLVIRAEQKEEKEEQIEGGGRFRQQRYRNFVQRIRLPDAVDTDAIKAQTKDGVLTLTIPKTEEAKRQVKEIPVHSE